MTNTENQPVIKGARRRRKALPELKQITTLIDNARALRLSLSVLSNHPELSEGAIEAIKALHIVSAKLETIAEVTAQPHPLRRRS